MKPQRQKQPKPPAPAPPSSAARPADYQLFAGLVLIGLTFLAYLPALWGGFIWDDELMLTNSQVIKSARGLYYIWCTTTLPDFFPLTSTSLWLEWRLWGMHPLGYHFTNVLLHALSVVLLWRVLTRLSIPGAWLAAAIFAVHPVNVESVAWIAERKNTLTMFFYALSVLFFLRWYQSGMASVPASPNLAETRNDQGSRGGSPSLSAFCYGAALLFFLLALLSKTAVAPLPIVLLLCIWWLRKKVVRRDLMAVAPFFGLALVLGLVTVWFQYNRAIGPDIVQAAGFAGRLATAGCVVWFYLGKVLLPLNLAFVYPRWEIDPHSPVMYLPGAALVLSFAVFWFYRQTWGRAGLFGLGYFVLMLLPILGFLNIYFQAYSLVADHWQYFAMIGAIALTVAAARKALPASRDVWLGRMLGLAAVSTLSLLTWRQAQLYTNAETLWRDTLAKNRDCWVAHFNLGLILRKQGKLAEAEAHYRSALKCDLGLDQVLNTLGLLLIDTGRAEEAIEYLRQAVGVKPDSGSAHNNLGIALAQRGRFDEAMVHFQDAIKFQPDNALAHNSLANILVLRRQYQEALPEYETALRQNPGYAEAHNNSGYALAQLGRLDAAGLHYREALRLDPGYTLAHYNLGCALMQLGQRGEAVAQLEEALRLQPDYAAAKQKLEEMNPPVPK